jgi:hypothetical protein
MTTSVITDPELLAIAIQATEEAQQDAEQAEVLAAEAQAILNDQPSDE